MATIKQQEIFEQIVKDKAILDESVRFIEGLLNKEIALLDSCDNEEQQMQHVNNIERLTGKIRFERREYHRLEAKANSLQLGMKILGDLKKGKKTG